MKKALLALLLLQTSNLFCMEDDPEEPIQSFPQIKKYNKDVDETLLIQLSERNILKSLKIIQLRIENFLLNL